MAIDEKLKTELKETYFIGLIITGMVLFIIACLMVIGWFWPEWLVPTPWTDNVWWKALLALFINYAIVFSITFAGQSLAPNLPDFFGNVKDKKTKNIINSLVWSLIFIGILLVFWSLILFFSPDSIQNGLPLDTVRGFFRLILGILPAEWILPLIQGAFEGFTPRLIRGTDNNNMISEYTDIGGKKGKKKGGKKGKKGGGFVGGDDAGSIPTAQWSQIFWTTTK